MILNKILTKKLLPKRSYRKVTMIHLFPFSSKNLMVISTHFFILFYIGISDPSLSSIWHLESNFYFKKIIYYSWKVKCSNLLCKIRFFISQGILVETVFYRFKIFDESQSQMFSIFHQTRVVWRHLPVPRAFYEIAFWYQKNFIEQKSQEN